MSKSLYAVPEPVGIDFARKCAKQYQYGSHLHDKDLAILNALIAVHDLLEQLPAKMVAVLDGDGEEYVRDCE